MTVDITEDDLQVTKAESKDLNVVCIYRSQGNQTLTTHLRDIIPCDDCCLIIGDLNICAMENENHEVIAALKSMGFVLLVSEATHTAGGHLDQVWLRNATKEYNVGIYSPYYTSRDHDALLFSQHGIVTDKGIYNAIYYLFL